MAKETWIEVRVLVPAGMQEEAGLFFTEFSGRGVILEEEGVPPQGVVIRVFFRSGEFGAWQQQQVQEYLDRLAGHHLSPLGLETRLVAEEDWAEAWKSQFKAQKVTSRLVIRPPWEDYVPEAGELVVTIYPGMAFGTGRHPTTLLCLRALEEVWEQVKPAANDSRQVLDVGTGTGILALAAARLGAGVLAIDLDPEAVAAALENVRLNGLEAQVLVEPTLLHAIRRQFALILANLTTPDLLQLAEALSGHLLSGGALIISGFLETDLPELEPRFLGLGLRRAGLLTEDDWGALILRRP